MKNCQKRALKKSFFEFLILCTIPFEYSHQSLYISAPVSSQFQLFHQLPLADSKKKKKKINKTLNEGNRIKGVIKCIQFNSIYLLTSIFAVAPVEEEFVVCCSHDFFLNCSCNFAKNCQQQNKAGQNYEIIKFHKSVLMSTKRKIKKTALNVNGQILPWKNIIYLFHLAIMILYR